MLDIVDLFCECGADLSIQNKNGFTGLHIAAKNGSIDMCQKLIAKGKLQYNDLQILGLDANIRDKYGFSASYWAKQNGHKDIMDLLPNPLKVSKEEYMEHMK